MELDANQKTILEARYLLKDENGNIVESPEEMCWRVARGVAAAEANFGAAPKEEAAWAEKFFNIMDGLEFLPNSPTLMNCGRKSGQLAACFVLPLEDNIEQIFDTLKNTAMIHKSGGGAGFDFSSIRPKGSLVRSTGNRASGPVSFMRIFNAATEEIKQGGMRRGANMGILRVDHPDIEEFISSKQEEGAFRNFNISVAVTDKFLKAAGEGSPWPLSFGGKLFREVPADKLFDSIVRRSHANGEPGIIFIDTINRANPTPALGEIRATNPCGEQPLLPYESCNLGSVNLARMVKGKKVDWKRLQEVVQLAVRFLDNVIEVNNFPLPQIAAASLRTRKVGLGVMGLADMLFQLRLPYDSKAALDLSEEIMFFISKKARESSSELARLRGTFPAWRQSIYYPNLPLRNATLTTIAPTGSISAIAGTTSGIEPAFALAYTRTVLENKKLAVINRYFIHYLKTEINPEERGKILNIVNESGMLLDAEGIEPAAREFFKTALEISPEQHLKMQAAFQKYTDNGVSKTVNLPADTPVDKAAFIFKEAHQMGLKGVTIYLTGSRSSQPLASPPGCRVCSFA